MPDSVFIKELENGVATETRSIPDSQAEKWILDRFKKEKTSKFIVNSDAPTEKEFEKEVESVSKEEISEYAEKVTNEPTLPAETPVTLTEKDLESAEYVSKKEINNFVEENVSEKSKGYDFVEQPDHYNGHTIIVKGGDEFGYETIEFIEAWLRRHAWMPEEAKYAFGNAIKYLDRIGNKPEEGKTREEKAAEDSAKIGWYINRATKALKGHVELYGKK